MTTLISSDDRAHGSALTRSIWNGADLVCSMVSFSPPSCIDGKHWTEGGHWGGFELLPNSPRDHRRITGGLQRPKP